MTAANTDTDTSFLIREGPATERMRAYFIQSTAPDNVDVGFQPGDVPGTQLVSAQDGIDGMADFLARAEDPEVVITIHGFNNPLPVVVNRYTAAFNFVAEDDTIQSGGKRHVCIGYRWPSEKMGAPLASFGAAAPPFLLTIRATGIALVVISLLIGLLTALLRSHFGDGAEKVFVVISGILRAILYVLGLILLAIPFASFAERAAVYFRDTYRATQYGVPDLVEVIRQLDLALAKRPELRAKKVRLSFLAARTAAPSLRFHATLTIQVVLP